MAESETLKLIIRARDSATPAIKRTTRAFRELDNNLRRLPGRVLNLKTAFAGFVAVMGVKDVINAANEQLRSIEGLNTAMRSMGRYTPGLSQKMQDLASSLQRTTNFGDEATMQGQKFLVTYKDITDDLLPEATRTMQDLAALMGGDVVSAANMLGKASMGMTGELRRVGVVVDQETFKMEGFAGVLRQIQTQVKGQARAMREATGPWQALGNYIGDAREEIGFTVRAIADGIGETMIEALSLGIEWLKKFRNSANFKEWAKKAQESILTAFERILLGAAALYDGIIPVFKKIAEGLGRIWRGFKELPTWVQESGLVLAILGGKKVAAAIAGLSLIHRWIKNIGAGLGMVAGGSLEFKDLMHMTGDELEEAIKKFDESTKSLSKAGKKQVGDFWSEFDAADTAVEKTRTLISYMQQLQSDSSIDVRMDVKQAIDAIYANEDALNSFVKKARTVYAEASEEAKKYANEVRKVEEEIAGFKMDTEDRIRSLRQKSMSDVTAWEDQRRQVEEKLAAAQRARAEGDADLAEKLAKQAMALAEGLAREVTRVSSEGEQVTVRSLQSTTKAAEALMRQAARFVVSMKEQERNAFQDMLDQAKKTADDAKAALDKVAEMRTANYLIKVDNLTEMERRLKDLAKDETKTITVKTVEAKRSGGMAGYKSGGRIPGFGGGDKIRALLERGEFVVRKEAVKRYGAGIFQALNNLRMPSMPAFATGGLVGGGSGFRNLGRVEIVAGGRSFPVLADSEIAESLKRTLQKERLTREQ